MKSHVHHPVNEWNSCQNPPIMEAESVWNRLEPERWKTMVVSNSVGPDPAVVDSTHGQGGAKLRGVDGKPNTLR